jgi:hypothetical protein
MDISSFFSSPLDEGRQPDESRRLQAEIVSCSQLSFAVKNAPVRETLLQKTEPNF